MDYSDILYETDERLAFITLNRPEKLNALSNNLRGEVMDAMREAEHDDAIGGDRPARRRQVLLRGLRPVPIARGVGRPVRQATAPSCPTPAAPTPARPSGPGMW